MREKRARLILLNRLWQLEGVKAGAGILRLPGKKLVVAEGEGGHSRQVKPLDVLGVRKSFRKY